MRQADELPGSGRRHPVIAIDVLGAERRTSAVEKADRVSLDELDAVDVEDAAVPTVGVNIEVANVQRPTERAGRQVEICPVSRRRNQCVSSRLVGDERHRFKVGDQCCPVEL